MKSMNDRIYLDNNATTSIDSLVLEATLKGLGPLPQNPSSLHSFGRESKALLEEARSTVSRIMNVSSKEIIFTSGGTESMNLLIKGLWQSKKCEIVSTKIEHTCVHESLLELQKIGAHVSYVDVDEQGYPLPEKIAHISGNHPKLLVLSAINTETGVKLPLESMIALAQKKNYYLVLDGVGLLGREPFTIPKGITGMGFSGHKFHAPKGSGFVYCSEMRALSPIFHGGNQEAFKRPGTENLAAILGLAKALELIEEELPAKTDEIQTLRNYFESELSHQIPGMLINGLGPRVCNTSNLYFPDVDGESLLILLDREGLAASHGSACSAGSIEPSRVLLNMGLERKRVKSSLRFSLSRYTTFTEIQAAISIIVYCVKRLQKLHT